MPLSADEIVERRRMRRRVFFWRAAAFVLLAGFIVAIAGAAGLFDRLGEKSADHIARVRIDGFIDDNRKLRELLEELGKKEQVRAVVLEISSPGGSTVGGEATYEAVRRLAEIKPVAASVSTLAASAAYMIACATDQIVSRRSSIVGSIGVLFQYGDVSELLDKVGIKVDAVKSAPLKAEPSPFHPVTEEARQMLGRVVGQSYGWFVDIVAERRRLDRARVLALADGSIYTGTQALENGLVDRLGGEEEAKAWLVEARGIDADLKIVEWKPKSENGGPLSASTALPALARWFLGEDHATLAEQILSRRLFLDGLVSVMQSPVSLSGSGKDQ